MAHVDPADVLEVAAAGDQEPVETLTPDAADPALDVRVRVRVPRRSYPREGMRHLSRVLARWSEGAVAPSFLPGTRGLLAVRRYRARRMRDERPL